MLLSPVVEPHCISRGRRCPAGPRGQLRRRSLARVLRLGERSCPTPWRSAEQFSQRRAARARSTRGSRALPGRPTPRVRGGPSTGPKPVSDFDTPRSRTAPTRRRRRQQRHRREPRPGRRTTDGTGPRRTSGERRRRHDPAAGAVQRRPPDPVDVNRDGLRVLAQAVVESDNAGGGGRSVVQLKPAGH
jgi:hypothetical protein